MMLAKYRICQWVLDWVLYTHTVFDRSESALEASGTTCVYIQILPLFYYPAIFLCSMAKIGYRKQLFQNNIFKFYALQIT